MLNAHFALRLREERPAPKRKLSATERKRARARSLEAEIRKSRNAPASRNRDIKILNRQRELAVLYDQLDPGRPQRIAIEQAHAEQEGLVKKRKRIAEIEKLIRRQEAGGPSLDFLSKPLRKELSILYDQVDVDRPRREQAAEQRRDIEQNRAARNKLQSEVDQLQSTGQDKTADYFAKKQRLTRLKQQTDPANIFGVEKVTVHTNYGPIQVGIKGWKSFSIEKQRELQRAISLQHTREVNRTRVNTKPETTVYDDVPLPPGILEEAARIIDEKVESNPNLKAAFIMRDAYLASDPRFKVYKDVLASAKNIAQDGAKWARRNGIAFDDRTVAGSLANGVLLDGIGDTLGQFEDSVTPGLKPSDVIASGLGAASMLIPGGGGVGTKFASTLGKTVAKETAEFGLKQAVRQGVKAAGKEFVTDAGKTLSKAYGVATSPVKFARTASRDGLGTASRQAVKGVPLVGRPLSMTKVERSEARTRRAANMQSLDNLLDVYDQAGAFKSGTERSAVKKLWESRAATWSAETGKSSHEFYRGIKAQLDEELPTGGLAQTSEDIPVVLRSQVESLLHESGMTPVAFTISDIARLGTAKLKSGAQVKMSGGPGRDIIGFDPDAEYGRAWMNSTEAMANALHDRADRGALLQLTLRARTVNLLASHGLEAVKSEIEHAVKHGTISPSELLAYAKKVTGQYNEKYGRYSPLRMPDDIGKFLGSLDGKISTFKAREEFAKKFFPKPRGKSPTSPFDTDYEEISDQLATSNALVRSKGTYGVTSLLNVKPGKRADWIEGEQRYPYSVYGENMGLAEGGNLLEILPNGMINEGYNSIKSVRGRAPSEAELNALLGFWALRGDGGRGFVNQGVIGLENQKLINLFKKDEPTIFRLNQESGGAVNGWYAPATKTFGAMTGKSNLSTFVHESFHHWAQGLKEDHITVLRQHFDSGDAVEFQEAMAKAFERYLRDGLAPNRELRTVFEGIREAMVRVYYTLKGTPLEKSVHPEIKQVFDQMLAKPKRNATKHKLPASGLARAGMIRSFDLDQHLENNSGREQSRPLATKYKYIE